MTDKGVTMYDGHYYVEDVAAARVYNWLTHQGVHLSEKETKEIARCIYGAMLGYMISSDHYRSFEGCREQRWQKTPVYRGGRSWLKLKRNSRVSSIVYYGFWFLFGWFTYDVVTYILENI